MIKQVIILLMFLFGGELIAVAQNAATNWVLEADSTAWLARDSQGEVVYDDHMWIFGGWHSSHEAAPRDVWKSKDGKNWDLVTENAPWKHSDLPMSVVFKDKIWILGGTEDYFFSEGTRKP